MMQFSRRAMLGALPTLGLGSQAFAQTLQPPSTPWPASGTNIITPEEEIDYLPDAWVDMYGRPTAKVMVNGKGPFEFMVDTGSTTTVVAERHLETLAAPLLGLATVAGTTGVADMPLARIDTLEFGVVKRDSLRVAVLPDSSLAKADGILGADVFAGRRLVFNIREKSVRVEPSRRQSRTASIGNMRVRNGLLAEIDGKVGAVSTKLMLDTGAQNCIANMPLSEALMRNHPRQERVNNVRVYGVTGHKIVGQYIRLPRVNLKAFTVDDGGCVAADAPIFGLWGLAKEPAMIVGVDLLSRLDSFSIDYGARMFDAKMLADLLARNGGAFG